ncbi:hypothetical protein R50073_21260 [Maricurvus nonylphenolicus]|uniref:hypothetical protein n=1 Tax=Maricurvus nonylphenolicus TaxID=1008307 RepID=UPI0036F28A34
MSINGPNDSYQSLQTYGASTSTSAQGVKTAHVDDHPQAVDKHGPQTADISDKAARVLKLEQELDNLYASAELPPITERQQRELQAIDRQIMSIFDGAESNPLSSADMRKLDELYQQADDILGLPSLSAEQQSEFYSLNRQIDSIFNSSFDPAQLDEEIAQLESLFTQRDELLLGQELTPEEEQKMVALEQQVDKLLEAESEDLNKLQQLYDELDNLLGLRPLTEDQQAQLWQADHQMMSLFKRADISSLSQGEQQQLQELYFRADKVMGLDAQTTKTIEQIDALNQSVADLLQTQDNATAISAYNL